MSTLIDNLYMSCQNTNELDLWYDDFVKQIFSLDRNMSFMDIGREEVKRFKYFKPYWDNELKKCWHDMKDAKKEMLSIKIKVEPPQLLMPLR